MKITKKTLIYGAALALIGAGLLLFSLFGTSGEDKARTSQTAREVDLTIIAFGDSLTAGYGLPASESYPAQLEALLKEKGVSVRVVNAGVSGETTRGNLERAAFIRKQSPDIVLLGIGGNDALRMLPLEETKKNIRGTIQTLQAGEQPPVLVLLTMQGPLSAGAAYKRDFDAMYPELAREFDLIQSPFTMLHPEGIRGVFNPKQIEEIFGFTQRLVA